MAVRLLAFACAVGVCYADSETGLSGWVRGKCEILVNKDWNTTGENLETISGVASAEACLEKCKANAACETFTWGHANATSPGVANTCWLKKDDNLTVTSVDVLTDYDEVDSGACPEETSTASGEGGGSSLAWWAWLLIALAALLLLGGLAYFLLMKKKDAPKKKKRAVKAEAPAAPEPTPTATPVTVYTAPPIYVVPQSVVVPTTSSFVATAAPATVTSDVVISRAEFQQFGMHEGELI